MSQKPAAASPPLEENLDREQQTAVRRPAARKADPHLPSPQGDGTHDDVKPSPGG